jgi:hypothetical protein
VNKKYIFLILLGVVLVLPTLAFATTVEEIMSALVTTTLYIADGIIVILWIVTGILFLIAQGDPGKLKSAKTALFASVVGTALIIIANSAVYIVGHAMNVNVT